MLNLYPIFKARRHNTETATPLKTFEPKSDDRATLAAWIADVEEFKLVLYRYSALDDATENDVFTAWKKLFRYFPEKLVNAHLKAEAGDVKIFALACGRYVTVNGKGTGKEWRDASASSFRKVVEDMIVDRIDGAKNKSLAELKAQKEARTAARKARRKADVEKIRKLLGCTEAEANDIYKARAKMNRYAEASAAYTASDRALTMKLIDAIEEAEAAAKKTEETAA